MSSNIRLVTEYDAAQIAAIYEPYVIETPITFEIDPPSEQDMRRRILETLVHFPWLVCEGNDGSIKGYVYASRHRLRASYQWSVDVAVYVDFRYHRKGIGRALYTSLFAILPILGLNTAYAGITLPNPASVGLHESLGFQPVGIYQNVGYKDGAWLDVGWWGLPLRQYDLDPTAPIPFSSVALKSEVQALINTGLPLLR